MLYGIAAATAALFLTALLAGLLRAPALRSGLVERRRRGRPVPLLGGVAALLATVAVAVTGESTGVAPLGPGAGALLAAAVGVALLGLAADLRRLRPRFVLAGTAVAGVCVVPYEETGLVGGVLAVLWITVVAAAFRALDHADGLAGTVGVVTALGAGVCAAVEMMDGLAVLLGVLAAALAGFLVQGRRPARIALGACGSLFTGFLLAGGAVLTRAGRDPAGSAGVLFALSAVAVADVVLVLFSRRLAGRPLLRGGPDHLAHRLRRLGFAPRGVTAVLGAAAASGVLVGVLVHTGILGAAAVLWVAGGAAGVVLALLLRPGVRRTSRVSSQVTGPLRVRNG
ncbi:undecaprenyl/decaprenyl-phosphate alpha-N-acetylglucosaminyl 1-phosphate transferase [Streptomyces sp. NPDC058739]|uniref:undecaprenyl/decaprenyl-phosphate alpha-N-acetylglucosaminyl 1-phosphate transferase n=1 Tax=Streptomyces sp. NPDC058739 TaxID=3346618 RepID=UPI0036BA12E5